MDTLAAMVRHGVRHLVVVADGSGGPVGFVTLQELVEVVLGESQVPQWLTAFRLALRAEPGPRGSEVG